MINKLILTLKKLKIDSKYPLHKIKDLIDIEYGTRIVKNKEAGTLYPVYGGGAQTFKADKFNREDCFVISRFGMSPHCVRYVKDKFFLNDSGFTYSIIHDDCNKKYLDNLLATYESIVYLCGRGVGLKNIDIDLFNNIKLPLPPMNIQEEIVKEIEVQDNIELKNIDQINLLNKRITKEIEKIDGKQDTIGNIAIKVTDESHNPPKKYIQKIIIC